MLISVKDKTATAEEVYDAIARYFAFGHSRFRVEEIAIIGPTRIKLTGVRLQEKKRYCGNHPNACQVEGGRMGDFLEGADWVEFNDRLNDICDGLGVSAFIRSDRVVISRKGYERRVRYTSHWVGIAYVWDYDDDEVREVLHESSQFENWCGRIAPASIYPEGTPGEYLR